MWRWSGVEVLGHGVVPVLAKVDEGGQVGTVARLDMPKCDGMQRGVSDDKLHRLAGVT